ncbi:MAG TPA: RodZ domain-containing protein [Trichocoleus sp.]
MANLASTQLEQLREIGAYLRQVREHQGRALDDIANQIFIRPALLRGIEEGQDQHLPEPVFVQGFIRRYAEALGLDGNEIAQAFTVTPVSVLPQFQSNGSSQANGNGSGELESRPPVQASVEASASASPSRRRDQPAEKSLPLGIIGALLALVAGIGLLAWALSNRGSQPSVAQSTAPDPKPPAAVTPTPAPVPTPQPTPTVAASPKPVLDAPVVADLKLDSASWMSIVADGKKVYEGTLESGTQETYKAQNSLRITSGNAGGVRLSFNGSQPVKMGESGLVKTLTLTPTTDPATLATP